MNPADYATVAPPSFLFEPSQAWLSVVWPLALALVIAAIEGWGP